MLRISFQPKVIVFFLILALFLIQGYSNGDSPNGDSNLYTVKVNGALVPGAVQTKLSGAVRLVDAQAFAAKIPNLIYFPMVNPRISGFTLQYGERISFSAAGKSLGFVSGRSVPMEPEIEAENSVFWTTPDFLAEALKAEIHLNPTEQLIEVTNLLPTTAIGHKVSETKAIAEQLATEFIVQRGELCKADPIELFTSGYVEDANGNNAGASYVITQLPPSSRNPKLNVIPVGFQMDQDEALVLVGYTPPKCRYFSYQPYLVNRFFLGTNQPTAKKIYARLGNSINKYNLPTGTDDPHKRLFVLIVAANQDTFDKVKRSIESAGITAKQIMSMIIPSQTEPNLAVNFGLGLTADSFNFLHRASIFDKAEEDAAYMANPTVELLRVTPKTPLAANPMSRPAAISRKTGIREQDISGLREHLRDLRAAIIKRFSGSYQHYYELKTSTWVYPGGDVAIFEREDVVGETNDTLYLQSEPFVLHADDLIVVFGVNHDQTGKSVYSNVACYGAAHLNGVGGIVSTPKTDLYPDRKSYFGTASDYLPQLTKDQANRLYVYKFARQANDTSTFALPDNRDGRYYGLNDADTVFMGFRIYVDVLTSVGPYPGNVRDGQYFFEEGPEDSEVFFDQVIVFSNFSR